MGFTLIKYGLLKPCEHIEHQIHKIENKLGTTNNQILSETFDMITSVKLFSTESHHLKDFQMNIERSLKNLKFIVFLRCFREFTNGVLQVCIFGGVLYYGLTVMNSNSSGVGDLPAFFLLIRSFRELFGRIKWHHEVLVREFADIERYLLSLLSSSIFYVHTYPCVDNYIHSYHLPGQLTELPAYSDLCPRPTRVAHNAQALK